MGEEKMSAVVENGPEVETPKIDVDLEEILASYSDRIEDDDLLGDILSQEPKECPVEEGCVIVDNIPKGVGPEKIEKLKAILDKIFKRFGDKYYAHYALDDDQKTKGYVFIDFGSATLAEEAVQLLNGYNFDRAHHFSVNLLSDFEKIKQPDDDWTVPELVPHTDHGDLWSWLSDKGARDQYVVMQEAAERNEMSVQVSIYWNSAAAGSNAEPTIIADEATRFRWTETIVQWSPRGTYMATFHEKGIALWAGEKMQRVGRFEHAKATLVDFSPCERYLVTCQAGARGRYQAEDPTALQMWDICTGKMMRQFPINCNTTASNWPYFRWSSDGKYFACLREFQDDAGRLRKMISTYETPSFQMLEVDVQKRDPATGQIVMKKEKRSYEIDGLKDIQWSPKDPILAYWAEGGGEGRPAQFGLLKMPMRTELRMRHVANVAEADMFWQANGDYLAVKADRYGKKRVEEDGEIKYSNVTYQLEIFRIREKNIPIDNHPVDAPLVALAFEPAGNKFCALFGSAKLKPIPNLYLVEPQGIKLLHSFADAPPQLNTVLWASGSSGWLVCAGLGTTNGNLLFVDANLPVADIKAGSKIVEHPGITNAFWDPTGRYFTSVATRYSKTADLGYRIYSCQGRELQRKVVDRLALFSWRPRPPSNLPPTTIKKIKRNMKAYSDRYEEEDKREKGRASKEVVEKRQKLKADFLEWRTGCKARWEAARAERIELRGGVDTDLAVSAGDIEMEEETIEIPVSSTTTILEKAPEE